MMNDMEALENSYDVKIPIKNNVGPLECCQDLDKTKHKQLENTRIKNHEMITRILAAHTAYMRKKA